MELSRATGVALTTGEVEDIGEFLAGVTRQIVEASASAGVKHIVYLSITNIEKPEVAKFDYYRAKALQEEALAEGNAPFSIMRSAQWMEFALNPAAVEEHEDEVAKVLVEVAIGEPTNRTIAGPEPIRLPEPTRLVLAARGDGSLLAPADAELLGPTLQEWVR